MDDEIPEQGDSHASSSHEVSLEPTFKRREDLGQHSFYTRFLKDRNCEICQRTQNYKGSMQKTQWRSRTSCRKIWRLDNSRFTRSSVKFVNLETITDLQSWCRTWPLNVSRRIRAKQKLHTKPREACKSFLEPDGKPKAIYTDNSLEFGKACEDLSWNHCTSTPHRSETDGIAERAVRRVKEGTSAVLLQSGLNECYTYLRNVTDLFLMGRRPMKGFLGNHLEVRLFHLVHWLSITL